MPTAATSLPKRDDQLDPERWARALDTLTGLSVADALGDAYFALPPAAIKERRLPGHTPWCWTDDTLMACSVLRRYQLDPALDELALLEEFAVRHQGSRGYGGATSLLLALTRERGGRAGVEFSRVIFDGKGSWGNGAAMRVAPLGAAHSGDPETAVALAVQQARPTHSHAEGQAGAAAVAAAAALAREHDGDPEQFLRDVAALTPASRTRDGLVRAGMVDRSSQPEDAAHLLGSGALIAAFDTVPFALWSAAVSLDDYEETFWRTVAGGGDRDTTCAIACGVVTARVGTSGVPDGWLAATEPLPDWLSDG